MSDAAPKLVVPIEVGALDYARPFSPTRRFELRRWTFSGRTWVTSDGVPVGVISRATRGGDVAAVAGLVVVVGLLVAVAWVPVEVRTRWIAVVPMALVAIGLAVYLLGCSSVCFTPADSAGLPTLSLRTRWSFSTLDFDLLDVSRPEAPPLVISVYVLSMVGSTKRVALHLPRPDHHKLAAVDQAGLHSWTMGTCFTLTLASGAVRGSIDVTTGFWDHAVAQLDFAPDDPASPGDAHLALLLHTALRHAR